MIATHPHVDLDAATCVALRVVTGADLDHVRFVSADADQPPPGLEHAEFLDHLLGIKGKRSALAAIPEARAILGDDVVDEIDEHDADGRAVARVPLARVFSALRTSLRHTGFQGEELDRALLRHWSLLIRGIAIQEDRRQRAIAVVDTIPTVPIGPYTWAIPRPPFVSSIHQLLMQRGVTGYLFKNAQTFGIYRYPAHREPDLSILAPHLPGWFLHPDGYLVCWGSRKSPRTDPPPPQTPQSIDELAALLSLVFPSTLPPQNR